MDTEKQIAEQLAQKVNQPVPPPATPPTTPETPAEDENDRFHNNLPLENTLAKIHLLDYFNIPQMSRHTPEISLWLSDVLEWAQGEAKSTDLTDVLKILHEQEQTMGNKLKPDRLLNMWKFVKIHRQRMQLEQRERMMYE